LTQASFNEIISAPFTPQSKPRRRRAREGLLASGRTEHKAILLSSVSFAVIHGFFLVDKIIVTTLFGAIAGLYYVRERNLPVLMATHVALDVIAFSLPFYFA